MKIIDKIIHDYKFIIDNLTDDNQLTTNDKDNFINYASGLNIDSAINPKIFIEKVNKDFFYNNKSPLVNRKLNRVSNTKIRNLCTVLTKAKFYYYLKLSSEHKLPHLFETEIDFFESFEYGDGENIANRSGYKLMEKDLSESEFGNKIVWSSSFKKINKNFKKNNLPCRLGLDDITIENSKYIIIHNIFKEIYYPTTFDAGFNDLWKPGGQTKPRKLYPKFSCDENDCDTCLGLDEYVHKPNRMRNVTYIETLN